jgi:hypothetical protein
MDVVDWLLDSDPSIRWQVMRDLTDKDPETVATERSRIATEGWGARLLALQEPEGQWDGGTYQPGWADPYVYVPAWTSTTYTLLLLRDLGLDPASEQAQHAVELVRDNSKWEHDGQDFFDGEVEPCINGMAVALGSYFGQEVGGIVERLLGDQMADGGWNCEQENGSTRGSFHSTISVLEGLLEYERATDAPAEVIAARRRGEEYLLERRLWRRLSGGEVIDPAFALFSFPTRWHYDLLRGLDYLRSAGSPPDNRISEALEVVNQNRGDDGRWPLQNTHPGPVHFDMDQGDGEPSRWNTLRAMRVMSWATPIVDGVPPLG